MYPLVTGTSRSKYPTQFAEMNFDTILDLTDAVQKQMYIYTGIKYHERLRVPNFDGDRKKWGHLSSCLNCPPYAVYQRTQVGHSSKYPAARVPITYQYDRYMVLWYIGRFSSISWVRMRSISPTGMSVFWNEVTVFNGSCEDEHNQPTIIYATGQTRRETWGERAVSWHLCDMGGIRSRRERTTIHVISPTNTVRVLRIILV